MLFRGGGLCDEATAEIYDFNRQTDIETVAEVLPDARILEATDGQVIFEITVKGRRMIGSLSGENGGDWFTRRTKT